jgi:DNA-directed RNA polymerase specialized sigma24 family protein
MNRYTGIDEKIILNVRIFARSLKRNLSFIEIEDAEQELMYEVLLCLKKFDENLGDFEHFIRKVLARRSANLRKSSAKIKSECPLEEYSFADYNCVDDHIFDLHRFIQKLPTEYKILCNLLSIYSISETAKIIGKSRKSLYRDIKRIAMLAGGIAP